MAPPKPKLDWTRDPSQPIPRKPDGTTPDPYVPSNGDVRPNFGTEDGDAHLRPTQATPGGVTSGAPQPRTDNR